MGCESQTVSDSSHSSKSVGSASQVSIFSEGLHFWSTLNWIGTVTVSADCNTMFRWVVDSEFEELTFGGRFDQGTFDAKRSSGNGFSSLFVSWGTFVDDNLKRVEITSVVELDKADISLSSGRFSPSSNFDDLSEDIFVSLEKSGDSNSTAK